MKTLNIVVMALLVLSVMPMVMAVSVGLPVTPDITTEDFAPRVWMCDRSVADDKVEPQLYGAPRFNNYAFEGESVTWTVLVMDKNGKEKISDVYATIGDVQGEGNDIEVNCIRTGFTAQEGSTAPYDECEATIGEEHVTWKGALMAVYKCTLTVETSESMYGEYWATVKVKNLGTKNEDVYVTLENNDLGVYEEIEEFELEAYEKDDEKQILLSSKIPLNVSEGEYDLKVKVFYDNGDESTSVIGKIDVIKGSASGSSTSLATEAGAGYDGLTKINLGLGGKGDGEADFPKGVFDGVGTIFIILLFVECLGVIFLIIIASR